MTSGASSLTESHLVMTASAAERTESGGASPFSAFRIADASSVDAVEMKEAWLMASLRSNG
jgi:hypothetical protein